METGNRSVKVLITVLRAAIGWHFLYEGFTKLASDGWSAESYLANSYGFLSGFYQWLAGSEGLLRVVDFLNVYGLIFIGLGLFVGLLIRWSAGGGVLLLLLYYFAYPPFGTSLFGSPEGHFFVVNRNLIEALVLLWFVLGKSRGYGIDALIAAWRENRSGVDQPASSGDSVSSRREALRNLASLPLLGLLGWGAVRQNKNEIDVMSGATLQLDFSGLNDLKGELPKGKIGEMELSRLMLGGNLIGGWAHARDLHYVSSLFKAYNNEKKVFETLMLAEQAGINSMNIGFSTGEVLAKYKKATGSNLKVVTQVAGNRETGELFEQIDRAIDTGTDILQIQGNWCDTLVRDNRLDDVQKMLDRIRSQGYVAGLGAHTVDSLITCEENGIIPDYYMKTMHHDNYWSAHPRENRQPFEVDGERFLDHNRFHDNCFCIFPDRTVEFVNRTKVPVVGFKVLAAGALKPEDGFNWAFRNGADFICVGMFDFQIVQDVNITIDILNNLQGRTREWYG